MKSDNLDMISYYLFLLVMSSYDQLLLSVMTGLVSQWVFMTGYD